MNLPSLPPPSLPSPSSNDWRAERSTTRPRAPLVGRGPQLRRWIPAIPVALATIVAGLLAVTSSGGATDRPSTEHPSTRLERDAPITPALPTIVPPTLDLPRIEPLPLPLPLPRPTAPAPTSTAPVVTSGPIASNVPPATNAPPATAQTPACTADALRGALFDADAAVLTEAARAVVRTVAAALMRTASDIHVIGHTDRRWTPYPGGNDALSLDRAESVKRELITDGIAAKRISTAGKGASEPVAVTDSESAYSQNRRVVVIGMCP